LVLAWVVGVIGTITTAISLIPAVAVIASVSGVSSLGFAAVLLAVSVMYLSVPILIALVIANTGRRWWLWLTIAIAVIVLLLIARFAVGSLGVYWIRF
jgi:phosphoglycerol transferase MdoB-like AlkP superfamily enzyme